MKIDEINQMKIDKRYIFHLSDGRDITRRGSWVLGTKDGHYCIDEKKLDLVTSFEPVND